MKIYGPVLRKDIYDDHTMSPLLHYWLSTRKKERNKEHCMEDINGRFLMIIHKALLHN